MKKLTQRLTQVSPILLAVALQVMPLLRNLVFNPAVRSSFAFILRWGIGTGAAMGTVDAVSGASGTVMSSSSNLVGTVGVPMSNNVVFTINGGNTASTSADFIYLNTKINNSGTSCSALLNGYTTNFAMPPGLTFKCVVVNGATSVSGIVSGTPATALTTNISLTTGYNGGSYTFTTNLQIAIQAASSSTAPVITNQPASLTNLVGSTVSFNVTAGTSPLAYQWFFNTNTALLNATNTTLSLTNIQASQTGAYSVRITNSAGAVTSSPAILTVWQKPVFTNQPVGVTTVAGGAASFSVTAGGIPTPAYQWQFGGVSQAGATSATLSLTGVRASQAGNYSVVVANGAGSVTSSVVVLVITNPLPTTFTATAAPSSHTNKFQFSLSPTIGLTNTIQTNGVLVGGAWATLTNIPPPATAAPIIITDPLGGNGTRFYRVVVQP